MNFWRGSPLRADGGKQKKKKKINEVTIMIDVMDFLLNAVFLIYAAIILQKLYKLLLKKVNKSVDDKTDLDK